MSKMILISCSDGRITGAAGRAGRVAAEHDLTFGERDVYRIKVPGPDGCVIGVRGGIHQEALRADIGLLLEKTKASLIAIAGHCDCAGYPVSDPRHLDDTVTAARTIHAWYPEVDVMALLDRAQDDGTWAYEEAAYFAAQSKV